MVDNLGRDDRLETGTCLWIIMGQTLLACSDCWLVFSQVVHDGGGSSRGSSCCVSSLNNCLLLLLLLPLLGRSIQHTGVVNDGLCGVLFHEVPVKHVVVGESLSVKQVPDQLSEVSVVRLLLEPE